MRYLIVIVVLCLVTSIQAADDIHVFYNAKIYTADKSKPAATALVVKDGRFVYVGDDAGAKNFGAGIDLQGNRVIPGMFESHAHPVAIAALNGMDRIEVEESDTISQIQDTIREALKEPQQQNRSVIIVHGMHPTLRGVSAKDLDKVISDRPALLATADNHAGVINTKMMELFGIDKNTPDPLPGSSYYERDAQGNPTGYVVETTTLYPLMQKLKVATTESVIQSLPNIFDNYREFGFTGIIDTGFLIMLEEEGLKALRYLEESGKLPVHFFTCYVWHGEPLEPLDQVIANMIRQRKEYSSELIHPSILKMFADGTLEVGTALMQEPYSVAGAGSGSMLMTKGDMVKAGKLAAAEGFNVHIHGIGDKAVQNALEVYENLGKMAGTKTIAHCQIVPPEACEKFIKQGDVFFNTTPNWMRAVDAHTKSMLGPVRFEYQMPVGTMIRNNVPVVFSSDSIGAPAYWNPFFNIYFAVKRSTAGGETIVPPKSEGISVADAIDAYTINCAKQAGASEHLGSITTGKCADFVILDKDVFVIPVDEIKDVKVAKTYFRGNCVFERGTTRGETSSMKNKIIEQQIQ